MPALVNYLVDIYSMAMFETLDRQKEKNVTAFFWGGEVSATSYQGDQLRF
jgi:hypothetical protein